MREQDCSALDCLSVWLAGWLACWLLSLLLLLLPPLLLGPLLRLLLLVPLLVPSSELIASWHVQVVDCTGCRPSRYSVLAFFLHYFSSSLLYLFHSGCWPVPEPFCSFPTQCSCFKLSCHRNHSPASIHAVSIAIMASR